ncbi:MAG: response regulator [Candidatus Hodarchaeales archaeon]|jgi:two-component system response regulator
MVNDRKRRKKGNPISVLLIEDNPADVRLTQEAFKDGKLLVDLDIVYDGVEAMAFLKQEGKFSDAKRPDLILLDLNLPKKDGREVLEEVKADDNLKRIPVVVLTTSQAEEDILRTYNSHANCYITKPVDFSQFLKIVHMIETFWFAVVRLPPD